MHTNQNHKTNYRIITALLLILWVAFIFSNSMDNADASTLKSGAVLALLRRILGSEGAAPYRVYRPQDSPFHGVCH